MTDFVITPAMSKKSKDQSAQEALDNAKKVVADITIETESTTENADVLNEGSTTPG